MTTPTRDTYTKEQWQEVAPGAVWTQFTHNSGSSSVVYTEAPSTPANYTDAVPINATSKTGESVYFEAITPGDNIYFWPLNGDVSITITKAEV